VVVVEPEPVAQSTELARHAVRIDLGDRGRHNRRRDGRQAAEDGQRLDRATSASRAWYSADGSRDRGSAGCAPVW
jgi:hypothetical protein